VAGMTNPSRLILLRHRKTDWKVSHRLQGQWTADPAPALTETGTQARYLAKHLLIAYANEAAVISSDLQRAAQVLPSNAFTTIYPLAFCNISSLKISTPQNPKTQKWSHRDALLLQLGRNNRKQQITLRMNPMSLVYQ
jgi:bisphosphoglycerate-dependent phosphoglycerate mutase